MKKSHRAALEVLTTAAIACAGCARESAPPPAAPSASSPAATSGRDLSYDDLVALIGNPDHFAVARTLGERLPTLGPGSLPALKEVLEDSPSLELDAVSFELLMRYWALHDPAEASFYALTRAPRAYRVAAIYATLRPWAKADPEKAVETARVWMGEDGDGGAATQVAIVRGWYDSGKPGLEPFIRGFGESFQRQRAMSAYATAMIRAHGTGEAVRWAESVAEGDPSYKSDVFRAVGRALVPFDLAAAQQFCLAHCEGPFGAGLRDRIASRWSEKDGAAALDWLAKAPESAERDTVIRFTYSVWSQRLPETAVRWMGAQRAAVPRPAWLAAITPVYARALGQTEPENALLVAEEIKGPVERDAIKVEILRGWRQRDEAAAEAWLQKSSLAPDVIARVREPQTKVERAAQEERRRQELFKKG